MAVKGEEDVADGAFSEFAALVEEEDFVAAFEAGESQLPVVERAAGGFVAEQPIGGRDAVRGDEEARKGGPIAGRAVGEVEGAKAMEQDAHFDGCAGGELRLKFVESGEKGRGIEGESETGCRGGEALDMEREPGETVAPENAFKQLKCFLAAGEKFRFEEALGEFVVGAGIDDDAAAEAHGAAVAFKHDGANGDAEDGLAGGGKETDGAGVDAARGGFEFLNDLEGAVFGGAGDGAGGKEAGEDVGKPHLGAKAAGDLGGHLKERFVFFEGEELVDVDGTEVADAAEVVAEKVDDHEVFAAVFDVVPEPAGDGFVFGGAGAAGGGAFHGPGDDGAAVEAEEQFRRKGKDVPVIGMKEGGVGDGLGGEQGLKHGLGRAGEVEAGAIGEVDLIGIAGADVVVDGGDFLGVERLGDVEREVADFEGGRLRGARGKVGGRLGFECAGAMVEDKGAGVDAEPGEGKGRGPGLRALEGGEIFAAFIGEESGDVGAAGQSCFDVVEQGGVGGEDADRVSEQVAPGIGVVQSRGLEQDGAGAGGGKGEA